MLTGRKAFAGDNPIHVAFQHVHSDVPVPSDLRASVPAELDTLVALAADRDPSARPPDAGALLRVSEHVAEQLDAADLRTEPTAVLRAQPPNPTRPLPPSTRVSEQPASGARQSLPVPPEPPRRRRHVVLALVVVLLLAVALGGAASWYLTDGVGSRVAVPTLRGLTAAAAVAALGDDQVASRQTTAYDEHAAKGTVLRSRPAAGTQERRGTTVLLMVSRGPERHTVPILVGRSVKVATTALASAHLRLGPITSD